MGRGSGFGGGDGDGEWFGVSGVVGICSVDGGSSTSSGELAGLSVSNREYVFDLLIDC